MIRQSLMTVQQGKEAPRIWIEGLYLEQAGFNKGDKITVQFKEDCIEILKKDDGERLVCGKKTPLIDLNNNKILQLFNIADKISVTVHLGKIVISNSKLALRKLQVLKDGSVGELFSGGGLLTKALDESNLKTKWAIEKNTKYADIWQNNFKATMYNSDIAEIDFEKLERVEVIAGGIPCENFSVTRRNKEVEAETMDLSMFAMMIIERLNPNTVILEEVPLYLKSEIGQATINALKRLGYNVVSKLVSGNDYGEIQNRKRAIIIASYDNINLPTETPFIGKAKDILLDPSDSQCEWFTKAEKPHMFAQKDGKFQAQIITEDTESIQGIPKRYLAYQKQNPLVKHPTEEKFRLLTITELRKIFGVSDDFDLGEYPTYAGEVMGQGVIVSVFKKFISAFRNNVSRPVRKEIMSKSQNTLSPYF